MRKRRKKSTDSATTDEAGTAETPQDPAAGAAEQAVDQALGDDAERQIAELKDKWLRARAELENVRRAARQEIDHAHRYGASSVLTGLLGVLDNLQRALASPPETLDPDFQAGLQLIEQHFRDVLATHGVERVPGEKGAPFDPSVHRALLEQETDEVPPGTILSLALEGYRLHDRLLREAQVVVARAPSAEQPPEGVEPEHPEAPPTED
jgi:molecular chaperone GrpE